MDKKVQKIDQILWDVEVPTSPVTVTGMMRFKKQIDKAALQSLIESRLLLHERFKSKIVEKKGQPVWSIDEKFDIDEHIKYIELPDGADYKSLQSLISELMSLPLDYNRPLWQLHLIDNYKKGSVLICRLHHAIGDGTALVRVILSLTNDTKEASLIAEPDAAFMPRKKKKTSIWKDIDSLYHTGENIFKEAKELLSNSKPLKTTIKESWDTAVEVGRFFLGKSSNDTMYKGELTITKKPAWSSALPLPAIKKISKKYGVSVNDVLLELTTAALRTHIKKHKGNLTEGIRVVIPVNIRNQAEQNKLYNKLGIISVELPIHLENPEERLAFIHQKTSLLKNSLEPLLGYNLLTMVSDMIPKNLKKQFANLIGNQIAGVVTNVPGPRNTIFFAGLPVEDIMFWVPHTQAFGIGVSLISYNDKVYLGVVTDTGLVDDPDEIVKGFKKGFLELGV